MRRLEKSFYSGWRGWRRRNRGSLLRHGAGPLGRLRRQGPVQGFGETVEVVARRAFQGDALISQAIQEHAVAGSVKRKKVRSAQQIRAFRVFLLERFRILSEESRGVFLTVQMQARHQDELLGLFVLIESVAIAVPSCRQSLCPVVVEELLQDFLPAKFPHDVFVEL